MTDLLVPDLAEPIVAFKGFHQWPGLRSMLRPLYGDPWDPDGPTVAKCERGWLDRRSCGDCPCPPDTVGHLGVGCGLYAHRHIESLARHFMGGFPEPSAVAVRVLLWGRVYEYELGYRAEFGQVDAVLSFDATYLDHAVADRYGVPVEQAAITAEQAEALHQEQERRNRNAERRWARQAAARLVPLRPGTP